MKDIIYYFYVRFFWIKHKIKQKELFFFNKWLYVQRYYDGWNDVYYWRFWILGFYFDTDKNLNQNKDE